MEQDSHQLPERDGFRVQGIENQRRTQQQAAAHPAKHEEKHDLALKVMRLHKPSMKNSKPCLGIYEEDPVGWTRGSAGHLLLPDGFGDIYIGQVFSCYINVCRTSPTSEILDVSISAELEREIGRFPLTDKRETSAAHSYGQSPGYGKTDSLSHDGFVDMVVEQELDSTGLHTLHVKVEYKTNRLDTVKRIFRKHYRFEAAKPLSFSALFRRIGSGCHSLLPLSSSSTASRDQGKLFAEVTVNNEAKSNLLLSHIECIPQNEDFRAVLLRVNQGPCPSKTDLPALLEPGTARAYIFAFEAKKRSGNQDSVSLIEPGSQVACVLTRWTTDFSEPGRLMSQSFVWNIPESFIEDEESRVVFVLKKLSRSEASNEAPVKALCVGERAAFELRVTNAGDDLENTELELDSDQKNAYSGIVFVGTTATTLGILKYNETRVVQCEALAVAPGVHSFTGICIRSGGKKYSPKHNPTMQVV